MGQIAHKGLPPTIIAGPVNVTEGNHEIDSSEHPPMEDRLIFQSEQTGSKHHHRVDTESDDED